ncbi:hypothetical protein BUE80_DR013469 [Diplocarpon rosae]|nr:hypothetical protein BUE80_DR013469 [Diplocarpon rosae]
MRNSAESDFNLPKPIVENEEQKLEISRCRALGILKCYLFNLDHGTLTTGVELDRGTRCALRRIMALPEGHDMPPGEVREVGDGCGRGDDAEPVELSRSTDESSLVIGMVDDYISQCAGSCHEVCGHMAGLAKDIVLVRE